jgi:hypothetical protein
MISGAKLRRNSRIMRWVHLINVLFVFSYIAFDVLDLDLSDFIFNHAPYQTTPAIAEAVKLPQLSDPTKLSTRRLVPSVSAEPALRGAEGNDSPQIASSRRFGVLFHRLIIPPRNSDPSPPH